MTEELPSPAVGVALWMAPSSTLPARAAAKQSYRPPHSIRRITQDVNVSGLEADESPFFIGN